MNHPLLKTDQVIEQQKSPKRERKFVERITPDLKVVGQSRDHFTKPSILSTDRFGTDSADYRDLSQISIGALKESGFDRIAEDERSSESDYN